MEKQDILNHIDDLSEQQLYEAIAAGIVTMDELREQGIGKSKRSAVTTLLNTDDAEWEAAKNSGSIDAIQAYKAKYPKGKHVGEVDSTIANVGSVAQNQKDDEAWSNVDQDNLDSLETYLNDFPDGNHKAEAENKKQQIEDVKNKYLDGLRNLEFVTNEVANFISNGYISENDLSEVFGKEDAKIIIDNMNQTSQTLQMGNNPTGIPAGFTEVYFWGTTNSGKTCALGAFFSTATNEGEIQLQNGVGYGYMSGLQNLFKDGAVTICPSGTSASTNQYLPFKLGTGQDQRSIALFEVAGEVFQDFYRKKAGAPTTPAFNQLIELLKSKNHKIHFFFVDYDLADKIENGVRQSQYLDAAGSYFEEEGLISDFTDAIYLVVTKSDKMPEETTIKKFVEKASCKSLVNALKRQCEKHSIMGGNLIGVKFSIGKMLLKNMCIYDKKSAMNIIDILKRNVAID